MKIHGTAKGGALSKKDFGVAFGGGAGGGFDKSDIIAYYIFDNDSGTLVNQATSDNGFDDGSGSDNDGTNQAGVTLDVTGIIDKAYSYDADSDSYTDVGADIITGSGVFSYNIWVYTTSLSGNQAAITGGGNQALCAFTASNGKYSLGNTQPTNTTTNAPTNEWSMLTYTRNGTSGVAKTYFNGEEESNNTNTTSIKSGDWFLGGQSPDISEGWKGRIDELCIAERVFTDSEITELYNDGDGLSLL
tara:strand:+ start:196 stop:933 length:738 start_codon:yes stop_codon:yes gene_type:complete